MQSEALLAFAGLHQLLQPVLGNIDELAGPQRDALLAAFGMTEVSAPDPFLTALAALDLLSEGAAKTPVLVIAEDAQWLDRSTADVLAFVARRLEYEPIVLLAAIREGFDSPLEQAGLPALNLEPLDPEAASALLDASAPDASPDCAPAGARRSGRQPPRAGRTARQLRAARRHARDRQRGCRSRPGSRAPSPPGSTTCPPRRARRCWWPRSTTARR